MMAMQINEAYVKTQTNLAMQKGFASAEMERAVIASLVVGASETQDSKVSILAQLSEQDFFYGDCQAMFNAIKTLAAKKQPIDLVTTCEMIRQQNGNAARELENKLVDIVTSECSQMFQNVETYAEIVKNLSQRRQSIVFVQNIAAKLQDPNNEMEAVLTEMRDRTFDIQGGEHECKSMADIMVAAFDYMEKLQTGRIKTVPTGLEALDEMTGGFYNGELTVIAARPAVGKSAFGMNIAINAAAHGKHVAICSREMSDIQFGQRILARETEIDGMKLRKANLSDSDWSDIADAMTKVANYPMHFMFSIRDVEDLRTECKRLKADGKLDILIVDYLQLMGTVEKFRDEHLRVGHISDVLKEITMELKIPVIALAQVNRNADGKMPQLSDLKDSGSIEQSCDSCIMLHRPMTADDPTIDPRDKDYIDQYISDDGLTYLCIAVAKQRQGQTGKLCVLFDKSHMRYYQIQRD